MKRLIAALFLLVASPTFGQAVAWNEDRLSWSLASTCQDDSPASNCLVTGIRIETGPSSTGPWTTVTTVAPTVTTYLRTNVPVGTAFYRVVLLWSGGAVPSNTVSTTTVAPPPAPPPKPAVLVVAEVVPGVTMTPAFRILQDGSRSSTVVGFVSAGKPCIPPTVFRYRNRDYQRVDPALVKWWATAPTPNVAAACG